MNADGSRSRNSSFPVHQNDSEKSNNLSVDPTEEAYPIPPDMGSTISNASFSPRSRRATGWKSSRGRSGKGESGDKSSYNIPREGPFTPCHNSLKIDEGMETPVDMRNSVELSRRKLDDTNGIPSAQLSSKESSITSKVDNTVISQPERGVTQAEEQQSNCVIA